MATLQTQYQNYLRENPTSKLTYDEWMDQAWSPTISDNFQIGPDGAYEHEDDLSDWDVTLMDADWDVTLMDGLEEE